MSEENELLCCPYCKREWPKDCEQALSVEWYDECIVCRFTPKGCGSKEGTKEELDSIYNEQGKRRIAINNPRLNSI